MKIKSKQRKIEVLTYDPRWVERFEQEKYQLLRTLGSNALTIEHIGSTSVVGLAAKPIIDILIEVEDLSSLDGQQKEVEALGYVAKGENAIAGRRYFQKGGAQRSHHIHAFRTGNPYLAEHRAFRDYLSTHPAAMKRYAQLKRKAAIECQNDVEKYMALKNDFITHHMALALANVK